MNLIRSPNALPTEFFGIGTGLEARAKIQLIAMFLDKSVQKIEVGTLPLKHHFAPHQYGRELTMPAGTLIVGKIHKHSHVNVVSQGKCIVATFEGEELIEAPATFVSPAGVQRAVYCMEDTVWTTLHSTESTDVAEIENEIIADSYDDIKLPVTLEGDTLCLGEQ